MAWGTPEERERRLRIQIAVYAYAYECMDDPLVSDLIYDDLAGKVDPTMTTGHPLLDEFFIWEFTPATGMWVRDHPEIDKVEQTYRRYRTYGYPRNTR